MNATRSLKTAAMTTAIAMAFLASSAYASGRDELNKFTKGMTSASAAFTQQVFTQNGKLKESAQGGLAMQQPRLFRWVYTKPYPQTVVADGKKIWIYEPDLKQATVRQQGPEEANSPLAVLINPALLDKQFVVAEAGTSNGLKWLTISPRKGTEAPFSTAKLGFNNGLLSRLDFTDTLGQRTQISFSHWKRNVKMSPSNFKFTPPKGVDVIGG